MSLNDSNVPEDTLKSVHNAILSVGASGLTLTLDDHARTALMSVDLSGNATFAGTAAELLTASATVTAGTTQTQAGATLLTSDLNVASVVANANDGVRLPTAAAGHVVYVKNSGANVLKVWPFSGDDAGGGVDTAVVMLVGEFRAFAAKDDTTWLSPLVLNATSLALSGAGTAASYAATGAVTGATMTTTGAITVGSTLRRSVSTGLVAGTTQTQGGATLLTADRNANIACANDNDGVILPTAVAGMEILVHNVSTKTLKVYPATGADLGAGANTATTQATTVTNRYLALNATTWVKL